MGRTGVFVVFVVSALMVGCGGTTVGPAGNTGSGVNPTLDDQVPADTPAAEGGTWSGTITFTGTIDTSSHDSGDNGQDPNSSYYSTFDSNESQTLDATDSYAITADDGDVTYGLHTVTLEGTADNSGSSDYDKVTTGHARNAACEWDYEDHEYAEGSWSGSGKVVGEMRFSEDGSYSIDVRSDISGPNGELPDGATFPFVSTGTISNLTANCEQTESDDTTIDTAPLVEWVSSHLGDADVNGTYSTIEGELSTSNPGTVVEGTKTWEMNFPEGFEMTIDWHLEHSTPIVLPHD